MPVPSSISGVVVVGAVRDIPQITRLRLPVFSSHRTPLSGYNRVEVFSIGDPIECGQVRVEKNDLVVADQDGVVFIPHSLIDRVNTLATKLSAKEKEQAQELRERSRRKT